MLSLSPCQDNSWHRAHLDCFLFTTYRTSGFYQLQTAQGPHLSLSLLPFRDNLCTPVRSVIDSEPKHRQQDPLLFSDAYAEAYAW